MSSDTKIEKEMNFIDHLSELRNRLIVTAIVFVLFFGLGFVFVKDIYFFFRNDIDFDLHITGIADTISIYIKIAALIGVVGTLPVFTLQLWLFIKPGLTKPERKASLSYIPAVFLLFIIGLFFGYTIFIKLIMPFLLSLNDGMFNEIFTVNKYFGFLFRITIPFALLFEIPIIMMFLTSLGILTPDLMKKTRKYAYLILLVVGALITPPDVFLQLIVAIPLILLYEISIYLSTITYRRKQKKHKEFMDYNDKEQ